MAVVVVVVIVGGVAVAIAIAIAIGGDAGEDEGMMASNMAGEVGDAVGSGGVGGLAEIEIFFFGHAEADDAASTFEYGRHGGIWGARAGDEWVYRRRIYLICKDLRCELNLRRLPLSSGAERISENVRLAELYGQGRRETGFDNP